MVEGGRRLTVTFRLSLGMSMEVVHVLCTRAVGTPSSSGRATFLSSADLMQFTVVGTVSDEVRHHVHRHFD